MLPSASATGSYQTTLPAGRCVRRVDARSPILLQRVRNGTARPIHTVHLPLHGVAPAQWQQLEDLLASTRIDQSLVLSLISAGFAGTDLARHLAAPLLDRLQQTEPVSAAWMTLVQQALCDPREVWEPAWLIDRARLRAHLHVHASPLLRGLYLALLRPWTLSPADWQQRLEALPAQTNLSWHALRVARGEVPPHRDDALRVLRQQWQHWYGDRLSAPLLARCLSRAQRLNRHEPGVWEPLVAVDVLREHQGGSHGMAAVLDQAHLRASAPRVHHAHPLLRCLLEIAAQARADLPDGTWGCDRSPPSRAGALCGLLLLQPFLRMAVPAASAARRIPRPPPVEVAVSRVHHPAETDVAPWPLGAGTQTGALTAAGSLRPPAGVAGFSGVAATPAGPPFIAERSSGLRPEEARTTVADRFTAEVSAHWLGIYGPAAADFNAAVHTLLHKAGVSAAERQDPDTAVDALFERGDGVLADTLQHVELPLLAQQLLARASRSTRIYLLTLALSRLFARIQPRSPRDPAMREAAQWMISVDTGFRAQISHASVRASIDTGDALRWLDPPSTTTSTPPQTCAQAIADAWNPDFRPESALAWPYGSPQHRSSGWFAQPAPGADRPTLALANLVFSLANPVLEAVQPHYDVHQLPRLTAAHWQRHCAGYAHAQQVLDAATCLQVVWHRVARQLLQFSQREALMDARDASLQLRGQLRGLVLPLQRAIDSLEGNCTHLAQHARARQSVRQFLTRVRLQQRLQAMNASAVANAVQTALPGMKAALPAVLGRVLGHSGFPDRDDLEAQVERLYTSTATRTLIAQALHVPAAQVDSVMTQLFFIRLTQAPLGLAARTPALLQWQRQLARRNAGDLLRGTWIERLSPARAATLFQRDDGTGLHDLLADALSIPDHVPHRWTLRQHAPLRLLAWLESDAGRQRMAQLLGTPDAGTRFLFDDRGLAPAFSLRLLRRAVQHHLGDPRESTVEAMRTRAQQAPTPVFALAVALHTDFPRLTAPVCLTHAAVLLAGDDRHADPPPFALHFPLPSVPANVTQPALTLPGLLRDSGIAWLEQFEPAMPPWQAWELLATTRGFQQAAYLLLGTDSGNASTVTTTAAQQAVARWLLDHGVGQTVVARLSAALDDVQARQRTLQATREALQRQLPALPSALARGVLWWLLARHAGRPEWTIADLPDDLDYGRSLRSVALLQAVSLCEAAAPGSVAALNPAHLAQLARQLSTPLTAIDDDRSAAWLHALVRPALLYAAAHGRIALPAGLGQASANQTRTALAFVRERQNALALAASQLLQPAPQRRVLAARQLHDAGIPEHYWNHTLEKIPQAILDAGGVLPCTLRTSGAVGMSVILDAAVRSMEYALPVDTLLEQLVAGEIELTNRASIALLFDQAYALYQQQMTDALAVLMARSLDGLPAADRQVLHAGTVTPLLLPGASHGVVLRCAPAGTTGGLPAPVYLAVIPSAGFATRLRQGDLRVGGQWQSGLLYPHHSFVSGAVPDRLNPEDLQLLDLTQCRSGPTHTAPANASEDPVALLQATAALMYGDFFTRTRDAELQRLTGGERLQHLEASIADGLARFAIPFYGCARDLADGDNASARVDCTIDALSMLLPEAGLGRFLRSTTELVVSAGTVSARMLLRDAGAVLLRLGEDVAAQSGVKLLHDLGQGVLKLGREGGRWLLEQVPALESRLAASLRASDEVKAGFALDRRLLDEASLDDAHVGPGCARSRRQVDIGRCTSEAITLFGYTPTPVYDTPGKVTWFAGMQVASDEPLTDAGRRFIVDGEYWQQTANDAGYRFTRDSSRAAPVPRQRIRATLMGGESQLVRVELHNPYPDHLLRVRQGAVIGRAADGQRALITRVAPGRFYIAPLPAGTDLLPGQAVEFWPLEQQGFSATENDAVKTAWWGAFHYSQQCQLSGAALVDRFGSQLQRQLEQLDDLGRLLQDVRAGSPYSFHNLPAQAVMSCAQSNCRYVQALRQQIGPAHWRAPSAGDVWIDDALRDLLNPPGVAVTAVYTGLDDTLEARFLTPRRGPAKTLALAELSLKDDPLPRVFHATSGQRKGKGLLPLSNLERRTAPAGWQVEGRSVSTPRARYIDAQPSVASIAQGEVSRVVPHHSLHAEDLDGHLFNERNARSLDAERNLYYRIERQISEGRLDPAQVTSVRLFSSRRICASCHISVGSLRARFPGAHFEVIEREAGPALDKAASSDP